jgi:hypothetical protein
MRSFPPPGFPPEIRKVWDELIQEFFFLNSNWYLFKELYGTEESVKTLNGVAPGPFCLIGFMFRREFTMGICRITDPKSTGPKDNLKENLTIDQLLHLVREHCADTEFADELAARKAKIDALLPPIRDRRNRAFGHLDLPTAVGEHPSPLPSVKSDVMGEAIQLIGKLLVEVNHYFTGAWLDTTPNPQWSGESLLRALNEWQSSAVRPHQS